ncbi:unnamed protein product [Arctia plantaginis]|uniref:Uncharacterized protein n=1 Tax=Arctia plantaginis TaxID=874455 RepID=A0A8S0Z6L5_ARCPL|nr:unnamed protein product [Arctia plantaginis]
MSIHFRGRLLLAWASQLEVLGGVEVPALPCPSSLVPLGCPIKLTLAADDDVPANAGTEHHLETFTRASGTARLKFAPLRRETDTYRGEEDSRRSEALRPRCEYAGAAPRRRRPARTPPTRGGMEQHSNIMTGSEHFNTLIEKVYSDSF